jgi:regulator of cell morphogenesis and NO signaling
MTARGSDLRFRQKELPMISTAAINHTTLGDIVAADYRAAAVFDRFGLDFCCGGRRTLDEACRARKTDPPAVVAALQALGDTDRDQRIPDLTWPVDDLVGYIVRRHHAYVRAQVPVITGHLARLVGAHGERHPEVQRIADHFAELATELSMHMVKEEEILFPYIRALAACVERRLDVPPNLFGTVRNPIRMMEAEHQSAGDELRAIRELSGEYNVPADGCTTYHAAFAELAAFDADLRQHIHLENNILFPHAVALEAAV